MACNQFTTAQLKSRFGLQITEQVGLFTPAAPVPISDLLKMTSPVSRKKSSELSSPS